MATAIQEMAITAEDVACNAQAAALAANAINEETDTGDSLVSLNPSPRLGAICSLYVS